jgi:hypothetical protein
MRFFVFFCKHRLLVGSTAAGGRQEPLQNAKVPEARGRCVALRAICKQLQYLQWTQIII